MNYFVSEILDYKRQIKELQKSDKTIDTRTKALIIYGGINFDLGMLAVNNTEIKPLDRERIRLQFMGMIYELIDLLLKN